MTIYRITGDKAEAVEPEIMAEAGRRAHMMFHALLTFVYAFPNFSLLELIVVFRTIVRVYQELADTALHEGLKNKGPYEISMRAVMTAWQIERSKWEAENPQHVAMREAVKSGADEKPMN